MLFGSLSELPSVYPCRVCREVVAVFTSASRLAITDLRGTGAIGDDAYRSAEEELDRLELSAQASAVDD